MEITNWIYCAEWEGWEEESDYGVSDTEYSYKEYEENNSDEEVTIRPKVQPTNLPTVHSP
ncbi:20665_t:CDS:2 [Gigaspora rosea]|nr:20665_t:CDS:2 [Gigaspora rosea]